MACKNCQTIRDLILHGKMADAMGLTVDTLREKIGFKVVEPDSTVEGLRYSVAIDAGADHRGGAPEPLSLSIPDLVEYLASVTDLDTVKALLDWERVGKDRAGAVAALEARRDALAVG